LKKKYSKKMSVNSQNSKGDGTNIMNIDTIRGCPLNCESCYAKKNTSRTIGNFEIPVKVEEYTGKVHQDRLYRIGNYGDPSINWRHSESIARKYGLENNFVVTKLVYTKGFTGYFKRLQVSVDTLQKGHLDLTLHNVKKIYWEYPDVKMVLRIRSISSHNQILMMRQQEAVNLANEMGIPVLDTRLRFTRKDAEDKYLLVAEDYEWRGSYLRPKHGKIFLEDVERYYDCDLFGNHCKDCKNCELTWEDKQYRANGNFIADLMNDNRNTFIREDTAVNFEKLPPTYNELYAQLMLAQEFSKTETPAESETDTAAAQFADPPNKNKRLSA
jgi:hypothetical protein